ncbi:ankyrin repeat containing protein TPR domain-containing protein [Cyclospora cayetanensis]|uniref:Ankyrin repeat containing protein TPR domain-containing protein n=1 Tax=Cyclospora cayetanensis TaxID=88456 RepID=A0A1D3D5D5_9EIME|nr:ankyrin repeat containing protein TPR domain-containing protein [Cyclospora cayetanensis]
MAEAPVASGQHYEALQADRKLLTALMEAAAAGRREDLRTAIQAIEERYSSRFTKNGGHCGGDSSAGSKGAPGAERAAATESDFLLGFKDGHGRTVVHFAALGGSLEVLQLVLDMCPSGVDARDSSGKTPLFTAASLGHTEAIELLLQRGAKVEAESEEGCTALHEAVYAGQLAAVQKLLLAKGTDVNKASSLGYPVQVAAATMHKNILELLLQAGANPNSDAGTSNTPSLFPPALVLAASKKECDIVRLLLEKGADPNAMDSEGFGALHCAAENDCTRCAQILVDFGADWGLPARDGSTPLDLARQHKAMSVVKLLEALGPCPLPRRASPTPPLVSEEGSQGHKEANAAEGGDASAAAVSMSIVLDPNGSVRSEAQAKVEKLKHDGNMAFRKGRFSEAKAKYSQAIEECPKVEAARELLGVLFSNRSFANEHLSDAQGALHDALAATQLRPEWSKAHYRLARAHRLSGCTEDYISELWMALRLDQSNAQIREEMDAAVKEARLAHRRAQEKAVA